MSLLIFIFFWFCCCCCSEKCDYFMEAHGLCQDKKKMICQRQKKFNLPQEFKLLICTWYLAPSFRETSIFECLLMYRVIRADQSGTEAVHHRIAGLFRCLVLHLVLPLVLSNHLLIYIFTTYILLSFISFMLFFSCSLLFNN